MLGLNQFSRICTKCMVARTTLGLQVSMGHIFHERAQLPGRSGVPDWVRPAERGPIPALLTI